MFPFHERLSIEILVQLHACTILFFRIQQSIQLSIPTFCCNNNNNNDNIFNTYIYIRP